MACCSRRRQPASTFWSPSTEIWHFNRTVGQLPVSVVVLHAPSDLKPLVTQLLQVLNHVPPRQVVHVPRFPNPRVSASAALCRLPRPVVPAGCRARSLCLLCR